MEIRLKLSRQSAQGATLWLGAGAAAAFTLLAAYLQARGLLLRPALGTGALDENFVYGFLDVRLSPFVAAERLSLDAVRYVRRNKSLGNASFIMPKPAGLFRIFVVGGSIAWGYNNAEDNRLDALLARLFPGRRFEVIGCGYPGHDSPRDALLVKHVLAYQPDMVVVMSGNNEHGEVLPAYPRLLRMRRWLGRLWFVPRPKMSGSWRSDTAAVFAANLRAMVRLARARGVPMVLCALANNWRGVPPNDLGAHLRDLMADELFFSGWAAYEAGDFHRAAARFEDYSRGHPRESLAHFYLARCRDALGQYALARRHYGLAGDLASPGRASPARNEIVRQVAAEEGAILAPLDEAFGSLSLGGIPGNDLFRDDCHWYDEYYPWASLSILKAVFAAEKGRSSVIVAPAEDWDWGRLSSWEKELRSPRIPPEKLRKYNLDRVRSALLQSLSLNPGGWSEMAVAQFQIALSRDPSLPRQAIRAADASGALFSRWIFNNTIDPVRRRQAWPRVLVHLAEAYRREKDYGSALEICDQALRLAPDDASVRRCRALSLLRLGRRQEAGREFAAWRASTWHRGEAINWSRGAGF